MIIKKFTGKTENDAVEAAQKELGDSVVIMNVKSVKRKGLLGLFGSKQIEVTAALEEEHVQTPAKVNTAKSNMAEQAAPRGAVNLTAPVTNTDSLEQKLDSLRVLLESQMQKAEEDQRSVKTKSDAEIEEIDPAEGKKQDVEKVIEVESNPEQDKFIRLLYNTMLDNEVDEKYVNQILEDIDKSKKPNVPFDYILANTYQKMILKFGKSLGITPAENGPKVVMFIGPTGVGKTTTIAKIASSFSMEEKKRVALLTADTYRIAAAEQLRTYANILEVPFRVIYTEDDFVNAVSDFSEFDYIFVDTTGHSHQNDEQVGKTKELLEAIKDKAENQCFLVLSAATKYRDLLKITEKYKAFTDYQLIFTKLDETNSIGNLLNVKLQTDTPIAYVTCGQNVPDDIEVFDPQKTVKQLLGGK